MTKEEAEKYLEGMIKATFKLSEEAKLLLKEYADNALSLTNSERSGAVCVLERDGIRIFSYSNKTGLALGELPKDLHKLVLEFLENANETLT